jgi:hypothetical protein
MTQTQDTKSAAEFYEAKVKDLTGNIQGLEGIVQAKTNNLRVVEEGPSFSSFFLPRFSSPIKSASVLTRRHSPAAKGAGARVGCWRAGVMTGQLRRE